MYLEIKSIIFVLDNKHFFKKKIKLDNSGVYYLLLTRNKDHTTSFTPIIISVKVDPTNKIHFCFLFLSQKDVDLSLGNCLNCLIIQNYV